MFKESVKVAEKKNKVLISDGARNFQTAHKKEFHLIVIHASFKVNVPNVDCLFLFVSSIPCLNGELRNKEKVMRGLKKDNSPIVSGMQIYHNYIRNHMGLNNETPADRAGIIIKGNNKWLVLIQNAAN